MEIYSLQVEDKEAFIDTVPVEGMDVEMFRFGIANEITGEFQSIYMHTSDIIQLRHALNDLNL